MKQPLKIKDWLKEQSKRAAQFEIITSKGKEPRDIITVERISDGNMFSIDLQYIVTFEPRKTVEIKVFSTDLIHVYISIQDELGARNGYCTINDMKRLHGL